jgi:hypothetical protein
MKPRPEFVGHVAPVRERIAGHEGSQVGGVADAAHERGHARQVRRS